MPERSYRATSYQGRRSISRRDQLEVEIRWILAVQHVECENELALAEGDRYRNLNVFRGERSTCQSLYERVEIYNHDSFRGALSLSLSLSLPPALLLPLRIAQVSGGANAETLLELIRSARGDVTSGNHSCVTSMTQERMCGV